MNLSDIANIERTDLKPYCLLLETKDKRMFFSLKNDEELYGWQDDIYSRSPLMGVSNPTNFVHKVHVGFDPVSGAFTVSITTGIFTQFARLVSHSDNNRAYQTRGASYSLNLPLHGKTMRKTHRLSWMSLSSTRTIKSGKWKSSVSPRDVRTH